MGPTYRASRNNGADRPPSPRQQPRGHTPGPRTLGPRDQDARASQEARDPESSSSRESRGRGSPNRSDRPKAGEEGVWAGHQLFLPLTGRLNLARPAPSWTCGGALRMEVHLSSPIPPTHMGHRQQCLLTLKSGFYTTRQGRKLRLVKQRKQADNHREVFE